jgi:hypothetical protein
VSQQFQPITSQRRRAKVLLIGEPGVGKSHVSLTFPKPAVIDAEGSAVREGKVPCDTLIIDSLTSIYNSLVNQATLERQTKSPSNPYPSDDLRPLDWGRIKRKFSSLLDELYHKLPCNVVCVGWIKPEYAKEGDVVGNKTVKANEMVKVGEQFDGDRKTMYAFDFVIKVLSNDGKRTKAQVVKSRAGGLKAGQVVEDFGYKTFQKLMPQGEETYTGMTDEEAQERDRGVIADENTLEPVSAQPAPQGAPETSLSPAEKRELKEKIADVARNLPKSYVFIALGRATGGRVSALDQIKNEADALLCLKALEKAEDEFDQERIAAGDGPLNTGPTDGFVEDELPL